MTGRDATSKNRIPLRGACIAVGYGIYLLLDNSQPLFPSACVGLGVILFGLAEIDRRTLASGERSRLMEMGFKILGVGLCALGLVLL